MAQLASGKKCHKIALVCLKLGLVSEVWDKYGTLQMIRKQPQISTGDQSLANKRSKQSAVPIAENSEKGATSIQQVRLTYFLICGVTYLLNN
jgi:hypothetical protein